MFFRKLFYGELGDTYLIFSKLLISTSFKLIYILQLMQFICY